MDYVDIESFRSKYSDLTVTAVPSCSKQNDEQLQQTTIEQEAKISDKSQEPRVEITRIPGGNASTNLPVNQMMTTRHRTQQSAAALAYASEYKEVLAKLEYTKYMQAQLQRMILANGTNTGGGAAFNGCLFGILPTALAVDENANIEDKYSDLLTVLAEIQPHLAPTTMGVRSRKDCLLRDIAKARVIVRECLLLLESDQKPQTEENQSQGSSTSE
ncbi:uncharacterized protein [Drosophila kikkawai]|uniref:Uncharacterized protein isoform X1 n=1 Tax=Drosophila kikkawai TaxID=30033 RepID=A0A6P4JRT5_DROKI|nr:uncharacterized protein LOC108085344 isoform X1 [Drosophila kikkawai]